MTSNSPGGTARYPRRKFTPVVGRLLDDTDIRQIEAQDRYETARTRDRLATWIFLALLAALGVAAIYGFRTDSFTPLERVWNIGGPLMGLVIGFYFNRNRRDSG